MSQNSITLPTTGTVSGLLMTQDTNAALDTLNTLWSGPSAPVSPEAGQLWHDTTANILKLRSLDNTAWISLMSLNETSYQSAPYAATQTAGTASGLAANMTAVQNSIAAGNKIRNSGFAVFQRGTSGTVSAGSPAYTADGFMVSATGTSCAWSANGAGINGSANALNLASATGLTDVLVKQRIESSVAQPLASNVCTF